MDKFDQKFFEIIHLLPNSSAKKKKKKVQIEVNEFGSFKPFSNALLQDSFEFQVFAMPNLLC